MRIIEGDQYSDLWWELRRGKPSASNAAKVYTATGKVSASQGGYISDLIAEQFDPAYGNGEGFKSDAMKHGTETEPEARAFFQFDTGLDVKEVCMCISDDERFICSPDGLIGEDGGLEIKCPQHSTHVNYLLSGKVPSKYLPQVHWSLVVTGRAWWDFLSYAPGLPHLLVRVKADKYTEAMKAEMDKFWIKYQEALEKINDLSPEPVPF